MTTTDKHLGKVIWGLFFVILALPVFAADPVQLFDTVIDNKNHVTQSSQARTLNLAWLDNHLSRM